MARPVGISRVWDETTQVLAGRAGPIAGVAVLALFLPPVVQAAFPAFAGMATTRDNAVVIGLAYMLVSLAATVLALWGALAVLALASDPSVGPQQARSLAWRRLPPAIGVGLILGAALAVVLLPPVFALAAAGVNVAALSQGQTMVLPAITPGLALFVAVYGLAFAVAALWLGARLLPLQATVLNERLGLRALSRTFALTRGSTLRLVAVGLLFLLVALVVTRSVQMVVFTVARVMLGAEQMPIAAFLAGIAAAAAGAALTALAYVFVARLYAALTDAP